MKTVIELAKEAGFSSACGKHIALDAELERFAALVRAEREWVDLTDDEIRNECMAFWGGNNSFEDFARAVIAAFKEKNK